MNRHLHKNTRSFLSLFFLLFSTHAFSQSSCEDLIKNNQCIDAISACMILAEKSDPSAQVALSRLYSGTLYGDFRRNYKKAFQWMEAAANQGYTDAEVAMAEIYIRGEVVPLNAKKAKPWYEKAAAKGDLDAINGLARLYRYGTGVRKNQEKAFEYYQKASLEGHTRSQAGLGMAYRDARGVKKNLIYAYAWFLIAASKIEDGEYKKYRKDYEDRQEDLNRDNPQCEYVLEGKTFGHIFAVGYAKQMLKDLKKRLSIKQIRKGEGLAEELMLTIQE
ncbi:sel1 repeat family protein [Gammaproteobacteria bacterium]|nr:sel1 repeat family protein [Gammaproteobacteria bacterium]